MTKPYYMYAPLGYREIRLVSISRGRGLLGLDGQLEIAIHTVSLDDTRHFDALSYTWGPATLEEKDAEAEQIFTTVQRCFPVICNGKILRVTRSLRNALLRLRSFEESAVANYFTRTQNGKVKAPYTWCDGICICQDDIDERNQQVLLMGDIYQRAKTVLAYVGEQDRYSRNAMQNIIALARLRVFAGERGALAFNDRTIFKEAQVSPFTPADWRDWTIFLCREWFFRAWIVQEAVLGGRNNVVLLCGQLAVDLGAVVQGLDFLFQSGWNLPLLELLCSEQRHNDALRRYEASYNFWSTFSHPSRWILNFWYEIEDGRKPSITDVHRLMFSMVRCSDPRDRVYALAGIVAELDAYAGEALVMDYRKGIDEVYMDVTRFAIIKSRSLKLLSHVPSVAFFGIDRSSTGTALPSWCPPYDSGIAYPGPLRLDQGWNKDDIWSAAGDSKHIPIRDIAYPPTCLVLQGVCCDLIEQCASLDQWWSFLAVFADVVALLVSLGEARFDAASYKSQDTISPIPLAHMAQPDLNHSASLASPKYSGGVDKEGADHSVSESFWRTIICGREFGFVGLEEKTRRLKFKNSTERDQRAAELFGETILWRLAEQIDNANVDDETITLLERIQTDFIRLGRLESRPLEGLPNIELLLQYASNKLDMPRSSSNSNATEIPPQNDHGMIDIHARAEIANSVHGTLARRFVGLCNHRSLFRTRNCRLGMGHKILQAGDEVWLLAGSEVPFVLRRVEKGRHMLIGEAYLHGAMFGELWPGDQASLETITLQ